MSEKKSPTYETVIKAILEFQKIGRSEFLNKYASGRAAKRYFIRFDGQDYDLKAIWAAAHRPPIDTPSTHTTNSESGVSTLGFTVVTVDELEGSGVETQFSEGKHAASERNFFLRNPRLAKMAKERVKFTCEACGFSSRVDYPELDWDFLECHHLDPIASTGERLSSIDDVACQCANCHHAIHKIIRDLGRRVEVKEFKKIAGLISRVAAQQKTNGG